MISFYSIKKSDKKIETKIIKSIKEVIKKITLYLEKRYLILRINLKNIVTQNTLYHALMEQMQLLWL